MIRFSAVHQFHPGTGHGDAITQEMLDLQGHLRGMGLDSEIFALHIEPGLERRIHPIQTYRGSPDNLLILHHSLGHPLLDDVLALPDQIAVIYHNLTPEHYFSNTEFRRLIRLGHDQLALLARRSSVGIANSNYSRREMLAVGFRRVEVLPVRVDYSQFARVAADSPFPSTDWLYVGRVVGNKCQHELVQAFALYTRAFDDEARLVLIGDVAVREYVDLVRGETARMGVEGRVVILGKVSDSQLVSAFAGAGVFVSMSEHEGFGVPIVEAMAAGLPVVAFGAAAVPEVMGGAGVLLRDKDPRNVAATVQAIRADPQLRDRLIQRQFVRVDQIQQFDVQRLLERIIHKAAGGEHPLEVQVQGPFETSYSLALLNREIASGLGQLPDRVLSLYATEGPGDYQPENTDLARHPEAAEMFLRSRDVPYPDVVIRQMYPPRVIDSPGAITIEYFGWEESLIPERMADDFNCYLSGVGVMSNFVRGVLRDSGVNVPIRVVGVGVPPHNDKAETDAPELKDLRSFRFLNIGSAFPRKGIDVLLGAYFSQFDGSDDVSLILKSFPNPHNRVGEQLAQLRSEHPNPPDVRWIDRDLDETEIMSLYNLAHCYVHPARGEGFGLPVAEAMAAGVPVISLAYSGLADFVSDATATIISYELEPARTHLELPGSMWAEPNREQLEREIRRMFDEPDRVEVRDRVERGRALIANEFSWKAVSRRWDDFISELEDSAETPRVAMIGTWNARCGVAEYTRFIVDNASDTVLFEIFANREEPIIDPANEVGVVRAWTNRWKPDLNELEAAINFYDPEVIHIQFNFGFFELSNMAEFLENQIDRRGVVMTLHRTKDTVIDGEHVSLGSIKSILEQVDRLIVHQESDAMTLAQFGLTSNVTVVPHGAAAPSKVTHDEARKALGLGSWPVIATYGFLLPHKGILELLEVIDSLRSEFPDICLVAVCARFPDPISEDYESRVRAEIEERNLGGNVMLVTDYLSNSVSQTILRAADAIVLPYLNTGESASGALRFVLSAERPIIVTDQPIFADCREWVLTVDPKDPESMQDALRRVISDPVLQRNLASKAEAAARKFRWSRIVSDHREIYCASRRVHRPGSLKRP
jgi:glycosyltransferase involved in cell wall biosynthesis